MKLNKFNLAIMLVFLPLITMAQQTKESAIEGKSLSPSDSLAATAPKAAGDSTRPAVILPDDDPIGDEEEMDSWENMQYDDSTPFWLELDADRDSDPPDQRERDQEQDSRE